jgi:TnpA family transposase
MMKQQWNDLELAEYWRLSPDEWGFLPNRATHSQLGFAILLKFFLMEGRFPASRKEVPSPAADYVAAQLGISPQMWLDYDFRGRSGVRHRSRIRSLLGFRPATVEDAKRIQERLLKECLPHDQKPEHLQAIILEWCRQQRLEPPTTERINRIIRAALRAHGTEFCTAIAAQLSPTTCEAIDTLLHAPSSDNEVSSECLDLDYGPFAELKSDPGRVGLASVLKEIAKLQRIAGLNLPDNLFANVPQKVLTTYRLRSATEPPSALRHHPERIRYTLIAAFCWQRRKEIIDNLVELLLQIVHRITVRAERKVLKDLLGDVHRVHGKTSLLYKLAEAAVAHPEGTIREVLYPIVGEQTLSELVKEYHSKGTIYRRQVHSILRRSYSHHYRRMMPPLLDALIFHSNNTAHRPIIEALDWLKAHRDNRQHYVSREEVPIDGVVRPALKEIILECDQHGVERINRINYEICVLQALRDRVRCKEIWVDSADRYRNPDEDLPSDFETNRLKYYQTLRQPLDAEEFVAALQHTMESWLTQLNAGLSTNTKVSLRPQGKGRIVVSPLEAQPEPPHLMHVKAEVTQRWFMTSLLDVLKEADLRVGFTQTFHSLASREILDRQTLQPRLLRCLYGLGTNTGLKRIVSGNEGITYRELLYVRRRFIQKASLRDAIGRVVNATFAVRRPEIWGEGTTACASDSKKFGAWDQNLMTEWHIRYGGRGVMIYWHVDKKAACIYSQLKRCSSSEVAAMIEGVLRHCTDMFVEKNYVDSHGQSEVAFAFCHLLGFDLLPRLKAIASQKLYRPGPGNPDAYYHLQPILTRPINWDLIRQQYDEMIKYAAALHVGTAEPEAILKRFTRANVQHSTYRALAELGKAVKTIFLCRYLHEENLRREVHEGLNVVETWNSVNGFIFYGKGGEIATNRLEDQEIAVLSLHLLQACLVYINTLMIQQVLAEPLWLDKMTHDDFRALSPLIHAHVNPYGTFELDMTKRIPFDTDTSGR